GRRGRGVACRTDVVALAQKLRQIATRLRAPVRDENALSARGGRRRLVMLSHPDTSGWRSTKLTPNHGRVKGAWTFQAKTYRVLTENRLGTTGVLSSAHSLSRERL